MLILSAFVATGGVHDLAKSCALIGMNGVKSLSDKAAKTDLALTVEG
jgi:hypothetical protein